MCVERSRTFLVAVALGVSPLASAAEIPSELQIHGFLSQGWTLSRGNNVNGESTDHHGSGKFHELGVNASWRPQGSLLFAAQTAAIQEGKAIDRDITLEYGLVDYMPFQDVRGRFGLRAGKLKLPIGLYNESRDAVFTRPGVIMPNSVYLDTNGARAFGYFSTRGAGLYGDRYIGDHALYVEAMGAAAQKLDDGAKIAILRSNTGGHFDLEHALVARIADDYGGGRWRTALSLLTSRMNFEPGPPSTSDPFNRPATFHFNQAVLSLQYNLEAFSATAEVVARRIVLTDISTFPIPTAPFNGTLKQDPAGWYLEGAYRFTSQWQALLRYDEQIRDLQDRNGGAQSVAPAGLPRYYYFGRDWTAGTRYDVLPNFALWAEFHYVDGVGWVNPLDNPAFNTGTAARYWNLLTVMAGLRF